MDFRQLETFIAIVKYKSFTRAAEVLYITQPAVTSHIKLLESELNTQLFVRTKKTVDLTESGRILYKYALDILSTYDQIVSDLNIYSNEIKGNLNISVSSVPRKLLLPNIIDNFVEKFPDISFNISNEDSRSALDKIIVGDTDFGIVGMKINNSKLIYSQIMDDHIVYVTNKNNFPELQNYDVITVDDIKDDKLILREKGSGTRQILDDELKRLECTYLLENQIASIQDTNIILDLVSKGVGSSFISQRLINISKFKDEVKILRFKDLVLNRNFYLVYNKNLQFSNANKAFKDFVTEEIEELKSQLDIKNI